MNDALDHSRDISTDLRHHVDLMSKRLIGFFDVAKNGGTIDHVLEEGEDVIVKTSETDQPSERTAAHE